MKIDCKEYTEAEIMKIIREWTEMTQDEFSKSTGITTRTIGSYEQGTRNYTFETLRKIARVHNLTITIEKKT